LFFNTVHIYELAVSPKEQTLNYNQANSLSLMELHLRSKAALEIIKQGQSFRVGNLLISLTGGKVLTVTGWTQYVHLSSLTKEIALKELEASKNEFKELIFTSSDWRKFTEDKMIEFTLDFDDYGKAGIAICKEEDGQVVWITDLKP
jgi:hypothetical protein